MKLKRIGSFILAVLVALSMINLTVLADSADKGKKWKVTFYSNINSDGGPWYAEKYVNKNAAIGNGNMPAQPTRTGYRFEEWNTAKSGPGTPFTGSTNVKSDLKVYARWAQLYTVSYNSDGGTPTPAPHSQAWRDNFVLPAAPTKTGHSFDGWNDGSKTYAAGANYTMPKSNVAFTARWDKNSYPLTINYIYEGGGPAAPSHSSNVDYGDPYSVTSPTIAGHTPDQTVVAGTMGAGPVTVTVTYVANGHTLNVTHIYGPNGGTTEELPRTIGFGQPVRVEEDPETGYTLDKVTVNGMTDTDATLGTVAGTMPDGNVEIIFEYTPNATTYTVEYYYGDGEGPELVITGSDKKVDETLRQSDIDTTSDAVVRDGYYYAETVIVPLRLSPDATKNVVKVYFSTETPPPPDEEQEETNFKVIHKYYLNGSLVETWPEYRLFEENTEIPLNSLLRPKTGYTPQSEVQVDITALLYPYTVEHYLLGEEAPALATTVNGRARLGSTVDGEYKSFNGYMPVVDNNGEPTSMVIGKVDGENVVRLYYDLGGPQFAQLPLGVELTTKLLDSLTKLPKDPAPQTPTEGEPTPGKQPKDDETPPAEQPKDDEAPPAEQPKDDEAPPAEQPKDDEVPPAEQPGENQTPPAGAEEGAEFEGVGAASEGRYQITDSLEYDIANSYVVTITYTRTTSTSSDDDDDEPYSMGWDGTVVAELPLGKLPKTGGDSKRMSGLGAVLLLSGTALKGLRFRKTQKGKGSQEEQE